MTSQLPTKFNENPPIGSKVIGGGTHTQRLAVRTKNNPLITDSHLFRLQNTVTLADNTMRPSAEPLVYATTYIRCYNEDKHCCSITADKFDKFVRFLSICVARKLLP
jgi:hypothetical protein